MARPIARTGSAKNLTATGNVTSATSPGCQLHGFYVNSTNAGTLVLRKGGSGGTAICGTITPAIGFHVFPADVKGCLHATIGGTALDATFFFASAN
jgi:hypothetical protein